MKLGDFDYEYPEELVATHPLKERESSRMMLVDRRLKSFRHFTVIDLPSLLDEGDLVVLNDTRVFHARLVSKEAGIEILLLREEGGDIWRGVAHPLKKCREGRTISFGGLLTAEIIKREGDEVVVRLSSPAGVREAIEKVGLVPLPPYILRRRGGYYTEEDKERYQTIYARHLGSSAAPTAGLHLSQRILDNLVGRGIGLAYITLHVGRDTFVPVREEDVARHKMHGEEYFVPRETVDLVEKAKEAGRRVVAVGTTVVRALETFYSDPERRHSGTTHLFIYPGYTFKAVDAILTNFHQPRSTLIMLVSAFAGREFILEAYREAIREKYRLFSFGDCMLIL